MDTERESFKKAGRRARTEKRGADRRAEREARDRGEAFYLPGEVGRAARRHVLAFRNYRRSEGVIASLRD